ncbi:hypothetical protein HPB51_023598 [Rhipicephalus microplus]|uniref:Tick transposon n=1 Tax=Rhipicephalus microplus TaxID=6941 RepID=A0A9J6ECW8_RHIMP|nr:hypothetical protein HPB51_023598 [Rhipicephalus microplus]
MATALAPRKQLCRQHGFALRLGADEAEVQDLWAHYLRTKKSMSTLVQIRIRTIKHKILKEIKVTGRDVGKKFWRHIQGHKSTVQPWTDSLRDTEMGLEYRELSIQGKLLAWTIECKYLGISITSAPSYLQIDEIGLAAKTEARQSFLGTKGLWSFNRFEVCRVLRKGLAVPGLTFVNVVLCLSSGTRQALETRQREVGCMAIGTQRCMPNEAVQGDVGWSSFKVREAMAKISYERRLSGMSDDCWARQMYKYIHQRSRNTKGATRTKVLTERFGVETTRLTTIPQSGKRHKVRALSVYRTNKQTMEPEPFLDKSRGSSLLS